MTAAITLLRWLHDHDLTLATCEQHDIDRWLAEGSITRHRAHAFLTWAAEHGHSPILDIPPYVSEIKLNRIEDDQRWATARRLLHDETIALEDRVAGLLLLLYAQPLERIARLRRDRLLHDNGKTHLALTDKPLELDPPLDDLVSRLAQRRHGRAVIGRTAEHPWLFPGGAPSHPITAARLGNRLRMLGIDPRRSRNTALIDLANKVPAAVFSRLLGLHIRSAARWTERTAPSNAAYARHLRQRSDQHSASDHFTTYR